MASKNTKRSLALYAVRSTYVGREVSAFVEGFGSRGNRFTRIWKRAVHVCHRVFLPSLQRPSKEGEK